MVSSPPDRRSARYYYYLIHVFTIRSCTDHPEATPQHSIDLDGWMERKKERKKGTTQHSECLVFVDVVSSGVSCTSEESIYQHNAVTL